MSIIRGSEWRKWDLHVHTPESIVHEYRVDNGVDAWEKFIVALENLPPEIKVIGINDYWFLDGYKKIKQYKDDGKLENIDLILPVVEFRLRDFVGSTQLNKINYHIIFSEKLTVEEIEEEFLKRLGITEYENRSLTKENLIAFGKKIREETPSHMRDSLLSSDLQVGFNNLTIPLDKIKELLEKDLFKNKYIRVIGKTEWDDFRWDGSPSDKRALINGSDFVFIASPTVDKALSSKAKLTEQEVNNCLLHCSDAHQYYNDEYTSKILGHCFTWIKADTTFEGLKQVIYEPDARLRLSENKPQPPLHKIEKINLNFGNDVKWDNDKFCFSGVNDDIVFSPNLTCIIGGRGSGKSTLLNLIAKKIGKGDDNFFKNVKPLDIETDVIFKPDTIDNIEFLAQNTIEKFATDTQEFTKAIYIRLNKNSNNVLEEKESKISDRLNIFDKQIEYLQKRVEFKSELLDVKTKLRINNNIVETFSDEVYIKAKDELVKLQKKKAIINNSRTKYEQLFVSVKNIIDSFKLTTEPLNNYDKYYNEMLSDINSVFNKYKEKDYQEDKKNLEELDIKIKEKEKIIEDYLKSKGLSPENIDDAKNAGEKIVSLNEKKREIICSIRECNKMIRDFSINDIDSSIDDFKNTINEELDKINNIFKNIAEANPSDVKLIEVKYEIDGNIFEKVFEEFESTLNIRGVISSFRSTFIDYISSVKLEDALECENGNEFIEKIGRKNTQAYNKLKEIFSNKINFYIYQSLISKHQRDVASNKILRVYYDGKPLDKSSFGQKCTSAIVILLSLGNNPIIIDEPEAHLDSSLIANYLVELIKQKKEQRQIIFATHNANFVLNADAELIIKLENIKGTTSVTYITIEDIGHRKDLLKLEGGKEAFKKRERKYNI